jgi:hypothetical protein
MFKLCWHELFLCSFVIFTTCFVSGCATVSSEAVAGKAPSTSNESLFYEIYKEDVADRMLYIEPSDWPKLEERDNKRRERIETLLSAKGGGSAWSYYFASFIFNHGSTVRQIKRSFELIAIAQAIDPDNLQVRRFKATAWDRLMVRLNLPQWYGTQCLRNSDGTVTLAPLDPLAVDENERHLLGITKQASACK